MAVMIVSTLIVTVIFGIGTIVWWAMMNDWIKKDQQRRGPHHSDANLQAHADRPAAAAPRVIRSTPSQSNE